MDPQHEETEQEVEAGNGKSSEAVEQGWYFWIFNSNENKLDQNSHFTQNASAHLNTSVLH